MTNPDPNPSTATKGMNEPGVPLAQWYMDMLKSVTPAEAAKPGKHRAGRQSKMGQRDKRWRIRTKRLRISEYLDSKAVREAVDGPGT